jgi:predicted nucleic acid-binding protein
MTEPTGEPVGVPIAVIDTMIASAIIVGDRRSWSADLLSRYGPHLHGVSIVLSFSTVAELRFGGLKGGWSSSRMRKMEDWFHGMATIAMPDNDLVNVCAQLRFECQRSGLGLSDKIHDSDRWIASTAIRHEIPLISDDGIFRYVPGLTLVQERKGSSEIAGEVYSK